MYYLYGQRPGKPPKLVATFNSEQQLRAYVRWAILSESGGVTKFEQGSPLVGCQAWSFSDELTTDDDPTAVEHNPSPSML